MAMSALHPTLFRARLTTGARVLALVAVALLAACSHKKQTAEKPADKASATTGGGLVAGGALSSAPDLNAKFITPSQAQNQPKFTVPKPSGKSAPDLASVPTKAPKAPSSKQERDKVSEGLIADRDNARYTDQGGRSNPVVVRPLTEAQAAPDLEPAAPPKPQAAQAGAVTRLGNQPAPSKADALADKAKAPAPAAPKEASVASAAQIAATARPPVLPAEAAGPRPSAVPAARSDGFRPLGTYEATTSVSNQVASVDFAGTGSSINAPGRRALSDAAELGKKSKGAFRVIARTSESTNLVQERATAVARELQRLGVAQDRIFVGTDAGQDGRVDVILDQ